VKTPYDHQGRKKSLLLRKKLNGKVEIHELFKHFAEFLDSNKELKNGGNR